MLRTDERGLLGINVIHSKLYPSLREAREAAKSMKGARVCGVSLKLLLNEQPVWNGRADQ